MLDNLIISLSFSIRHIPGPDYKQLLLIMFLDFYNHVKCSIVEAEHKCIMATLTLSIIEVG